MKKLLVFLFYFSLSSIITFPLILNLNDILIGWPLDAYNYLWNIDTFWQQALSVQNPFFTQRIFYPLGTYLIFHTYAPTISLLGGLFLKHPILYLNLLVLISPALSGYFTYLLVSYLTKNKTAALFSGLLYGFSPIIISFLVSQHYYFAFAAPLLPLGLFFLIKFLEKGTVKHLITFIVLFWLVVGIDYYSTIMFVMISTLFFLFYLIVNLKKVTELIKSNFKRIIISTFLLLVIPTTIIYSQIKNNQDSESYLNSKSYYPAICSATIQKLFTPSIFNPVLKNIKEKYDFKINAPINHDTPSVFIGFIIPLLAVTSIFLNPIKKTLPFIGITTVFFYFSLGPVTAFFDLVTKIPFLGLIDCPQRFTVGIQLPVAILVGFLIAKIDLIKFKNILLPILLLLFVIEYLSFNIPYTKVEIPNVYKEIAKNTSSKAILEIPSGIADSKGAFGYDWSIEGLLLKQMYWQTIHNKPRVGGYTSRLTQSYYDYYKREKVISDIFTLSTLNGEWTQNEFDNKELDLFLNKFNIGFIILSPNQRQTEFSSVIENLFSKRIVRKINSEGYVLYLIN